MYKRLVPLSSTEHSKLCLLPVKDYRFARNELVAPIVIDEIAEVAREYPIVFPAGSRLPVAMLGVDEDSNAYVAPNGQWLANYVPTHIRHYPLVLARVPDSKASEESKAEVRYVVMLDVESPLVSEQQGEPLFDAQGKLSGVAAQKKSLMDQMQQRVPMTQRLVQAIEEAGLLMERSIRIRREGQPDRLVTGVRVIDEAVLNKLGDASFNRLRHIGALPLIYAALLSWANFRKGPIGQSHPLESASAVPAGDVIRFN